MAISYNNSTGSAKTPGEYDMTSSFTVNSGTDRILIVAVLMGGNDYVSSVTYNGVSLTYLTDITEANRCSKVYYLVNPPVGTFNVVVNFSAVYNYNTGLSISAYNGVDQTNPIDSYNQVGLTSGSVYSLTVPTTVVNPNCWLVSVFSGYLAQGSRNVSSNRTTRWNTNNDTYNVYGMADSNGTVGTGTQSTIFTTNATTNANWCNGISLSLREAGSGGANFMTFFTNYI